MGKSRAEIQKAYRERQKAKGHAFLDKERLRSKQNYVPADALNQRKLAERNRRNKLRNRLCRARKKQRELAVEETVEQTSGYGSNFQSSDNEQLDSPLSSPGPQQETPRSDIQSPQPGPSGQHVQRTKLLVKLPVPCKKKNLTKIRRRALGKAQRQVYQLKREVTELKRKIRAKGKRIQRLAKKKGTDSENNDDLTPNKKTDRFVDTLSLTPRRKQKVRRKVLIGNIMSSEIEDLRKSVSQKKRSLLHRIVAGRITKKYRCVKALSSETGLSRTSLLRTSSSLNKSLCLSPEQRKCLTRDVADTVESFLRRDDNSRMQPGKNDAKKVDGEKKQTRVLTDYLRNLHCKFSAENSSVKMSLALFCRLRPKDVLLASFISRNACLCIKHQNMAHLVQAVRKQGVKISDNPENLLIHVDDIETILKDLPAIVTYKCWKRVPVENGVLKMKLIEQNLAAAEFRALMKKHLDDFAIHVHTLRHQYKQLKNLKDKLPTHDMIVQMDFEENFSCRSLDEVQTAYWNQTSVTQHPTVVYYKRDDVLLHQSFVFISNTVSHSAGTVCAFLDLLIPDLKEIDPEVNVVHYWTDSPSSQYRNRYMFNFVANHSDAFDGVAAKWNYFEAGHGKGPCDGLGGTTKRLADEAIRQGNASIQDAADFHKWAKGSNMKDVKFLYVSKEAVKEKHDSMVSGNFIKPVKNTMKLHAVGALKDPSHLMVNGTSCYCDDCLKGEYCDNWTEVRLQSGHPSTTRRTPIEVAVHIMENTPPAYPSEPDIQVASSSEPDIQVAGPSEPDIQVAEPIEPDIQVASRSGADTNVVYNIGDFVAAVYDGDWYVGRIDTVDQDDVEFEISFLQRVKSQYRWPSRADCLWMSREQILFKVKPPKPIGKYGRQLTLAKDDIVNIQKIFNDVDAEN